MKRTRIEVGVLRNEITTWPMDYRTWAVGGEIGEALSWVINMAQRGKETIAGFRLTNES